MRKVREVLRLKWACGLGDRAVAASCSLSRSTVSKYVRRAKEAGLSWPLPDALTDEVLERRLFPVEEAGPHFVADWVEVHRQLKRKSVTLRLVWEEYKEAHSDGFQRKLRNPFLGMLVLQGFGTIYSLRRVSKLGTRHRVMSFCA